MNQPWRYVASLIIALGTFLLPVGVSAQEVGPHELPSFMEVNEAGQVVLNLRTLTPIGQIVAPPPEGWPSASFEIGGAQILLGEMVYNQYLSPLGEYVVVPTPYTAAVLAVTNSPPFNVKPEAVLFNAATAIPGMFGLLENAGLSSEEVRETILRVLTEGPDVDALSALQLLLAVLNPNDPLSGDYLFLASGLWVYACDPLNPADCAPESAAVAQPPSLPASAAVCPAASIVQAEVRVIGELEAPPYPIVVGQDRNRRGADLRWRVEVPPVVHTWYEPRVVGMDAVCEYDASARSGGCPGPGSRYAEVVGSRVGWRPWMATDPHWREQDDRPRIECVRHVVIYPDRLQWVVPTASLLPASREWILGELAARYPGAGLYHPNWTWRPPVSGSTRGDSTFVWEWVERGVPFRDPGEYTMNVRGATTGTTVTPGRFFDLPASVFTVWLQEAAISR